MSAAPSPGPAPAPGKGLSLPSFQARLAPNPDGSPWWARVFRITNVRVVSQAFFFGLFVFLLWVTWLSRLKGYPASLFLEMDPLVGFATALSTHTVYRQLWWGLFLLVPTLLLGRVFCNWVCPYGTLHQFIGWLFNIRNNKNRIDRNRYRPLFQMKYYVLGVFLVMAAFGSLQIGLLDPICLLVRTFTVTIIPAVDWGLASLAAQGLAAASALVFKPATPEPRVFAGAWFVGRAHPRPRRREPRHPALLLPRPLPARRLPRRPLALGPLADRPRRDEVHRLRPLPEGVRGRLRPAGRPAQERVLRLLQLHRRLPRGRADVPLQPARRRSRSLVKGSAKDGTATLGGLPVISKNLAVEVKAPDVPRRRWLFTAVAGVARLPVPALLEGRQQARLPPRRRSARPAPSPSPSSSSAASSATSASTSARRTSCSRRSSRSRASRGSGRR